MMTYHFKIEKDNYGEFRNIECNSIFSKTNQGGSKRCASRKWLIKNANEDNFPVCLYFKILEKCPQGATTDRFFLTENPNWENACWYKNCPIGINKLSSWTKESAKKISLDIVNKKFTPVMNTNIFVYLYIFFLARVHPRQVGCAELS
ncbi:hypothetical protein Zmor_024422 [Zophobas morio]|uniref:Uncharacterized protein n=1 Tax=Zophobas morio TaxID=2755281 RepID=A0AA38I278_9CUCU|nr:hypothetical protein Zmor_024422 [Zophobas morio]